ncbi:MAG: hypothetical protein AAF378_10650 [Cyanobacteria bacterium P01_A01_bin.84]
MALDNAQRQLSRILSPRLTAVVREALFRFDKVATGETARSISTQIRFNSQNQYRIQIRGREGLRYILDGRKPQTSDANIPPVERIEAWQAARGVGGSPYAIARSINVRGIPGIRNEFTEYILGRIADEIRSIQRNGLFLSSIREDIRQLLINGFRGVKNTTITR